MAEGAKPQAGAVNEFRANWFLILTVFVGATLPSTLAFATGVFTGPWEERFGWSRGQIGVALGVLHISVIVMAPIVGALIQRFGVRRPTLWCLGVMPFLLAGFSLIGPQLWTLYAAYALFGAVVTGAGFISYTRAVNEYFDKARGVALSLACSATTLTAIAVPLLAHRFIDVLGWRNAWLGLAGVVVVIWPLIFLGLKEVKQRGSHAGAAESAADFPRERPLPLLRSRSFWLLAASFFLMTFVASGLQVQSVPYLMSVGFTRHEAVGAAAALAVGLGVSRLATGFFLDRVLAPIVFVIVAVIGLVGCGALLVGGGLAIVGIIAVGAVMGADGDILPYAASRYFGRRRYAKSYGALYGANAAGAMLAPAVNGFIFDLSHSYTLTIYLAMAALVLSAVLICLLPPYPTPNHLSRSEAGSRAYPEPSTSVPPRSTRAPAKG